MTHPTVLITPVALPVHSLTAAHQGDAVGLYSAGKEFKKEITPKRGAAHMGVILDAIAEMEPSGETGLPEVPTKQRKSSSARTICCYL